MVHACIMKSSPCISFEERMESGSGDSKSFSCESKHKECIQKALSPLSIMTRTPRTSKKQVNKLKRLRVLPNNRNLFKNQVLEERKKCRSYLEQMLCNSQKKHTPGIRAMDYTLSETNAMLLAVMSCWHEKQEEPYRSPESFFNFKFKKGDKAHM